MSSPRRLVLLCFSAIREGRVVRDWSLLTSCTLDFRVSCRFLISYVGLFSRLRRSTWLQSQGVVVNKGQLLVWLCVPVGSLGKRRCKVATRAAIYRSLSALRARNRKKVSKQVFWGVCREVPKNTRKSLKIPKKVRKLVFLDFFGCFLGLLCRPPKDLFWDFFAILGPEGPETPVNGGSGRKCKDRGGWDTWSWRNEGWGMEKEKGRASHCCQPALANRSLLGPETLRLEFFLSEQKSNSAPTGGIVKTRGLTSIACTNLCSLWAQELSY